jgi:hypothetical protein
VIALVAAVLLAAEGPALPEGSARYRVELAGAAVGAAELSLACAAPGRCRVRWEARLRLPAEAGGGLRTRRIEAAVDGEGRLLGPAVVELQGVRRRVRGPPGALPLALAELVLGARGGGCAQVLDEEAGRAHQVCARRDGELLRLALPGGSEEVRLGADGFPDEVALPAQATRFTRDPAAAPPSAPPPLEVRVAGPPAGRPARRFCGRAPDPAADAAGLPELPELRPDGRSCRAQAADYAAQVRRTGRDARIAVGAAHDGAGYTWHAWVEVRSGAGWLPVDPAFGQLPALGPRFTVARHRGDAAGAAEAGRRILECWGRAAVE